MPNVHYLPPRANPSLSPLMLGQTVQAWASLLQWLPIGIYTCDSEGTITQFNRRAAELWGRTPDLMDARERFSGAYRLFRIDGRYLPHSESPIARVLHTGSPARDEEAWIERPDGSRIAALMNADPLLDEKGLVVGAVGCIQDITQLKHSQMLIGERELWFRQLLDALPAAVYTTDAQGRITFYNEAAVELGGRRPELGSDRWCISWKLYWPDGRPMPHGDCPMAMALKEQRSIRGAEAIVERPDGTRVPIIPYPTPLFDEYGRLVGGVNMLVDITARKDAEDRQKALLDELDHRVKNSLFNVQSIAAQSLRKPGVPAQARDNFETRLYVLSRVHNELSRAHWDSADLKSIIFDTFAAMRAGASHDVRLDGASVRLAANQALTLAMIMQELASNAARHGSLSVAGGVVHLAWTVDQEQAPRRLRICWKETGGPSTSAAAELGFGLRLLDRGVRQELKGNAEVSFAEAGFNCRLDIPLA